MTDFNITKRKSRLSCSEWSGEKQDFIECKGWNKQRCPKATDLLSTCFVAQLFDCFVPDRKSLFEACLWPKTTYILNFCEPRGRNLHLNEDRLQRKSLWSLNVGFSSHILYSSVCTSYFASTNTSMCHHFFVISKSCIPLKYFCTIGWSVFISVSMPISF